MYIYICIYMCMYVYICVCIYMCMYIYMYVLICMLIAHAPHYTTILFII